MQVQNKGPAVIGGDPDMPQAGMVLDGRFQITDLLSCSGMAVLFLAQDLARGREQVVVKIPHLRIESDPAYFTRFQREEEIGLTLDHPFLLRFIAVEEPKSRPYLVTEYVPGSTLEQLLKSATTFSEEDAFTLALALCDALEYLHARGIVHRDIKPGNVIVARDGGIRLLDFGLSNSHRLRRVTFAGFSPAMGTPEYMSPEQAKGGRGDQRSDIYSLGAVLYEMLTGQPPFSGDSPMAILTSRGLADPAPLRELRPELSPQAEEIVLHAMERNPGSRHASVADLAAELRAPARVVVTGRAQRVRKLSRFELNFARYRGAIFALGLPAAGLAATALWMWWRFHAR